MANESVTETTTTTAKMPATQAPLVKANGKSEAAQAANEMLISEITVTPEFNFDTRRMNDEKSIRQLASSIEATDGLLQPVLVGRRKPYRAASSRWGRPSPSPATTICGPSGR